VQNKRLAEALVENEKLAAGLRKQIEDMTSETAQLRRVFGTRDAMPRKTKTSTFYLVMDVSEIEGIERADAHLQDLLDSGWRIAFDNATTVVFGDGLTHTRMVTLTRETEVKPADKPEKVQAASTPPMTEATHACYGDQFVEQQKADADGKVMEKARAAYDQAIGNPFKKKAPDAGFPQLVILPTNAVKVKK
jgi:hypothetical protein